MYNILCNYSFVKKASFILLCYILWGENDLELYKYACGTCPFCLHNRDLLRFQHIPFISVATHVTAHGMRVIWQWNWAIKRRSLNEYTPVARKRVSKLERSVRSRSEGGYAVVYWSHFVRSVTFYGKITRVSRDNGCSASLQLLLPVNRRVDSCYEGLWYNDGCNGNQRGCSVFSMWDFVVQRSVAEK